MQIYSSAIGLEFNHLKKMSFLYLGKLAENKQTLLVFIGNYFNFVGLVKFHQDEMGVIK